MNVLTEIDVHEISQVTRGAQKQTFLMTKSEDTEEEGQMTIEAILKTMLEGEAENEAQVVALLQKADLTEQEVLQVKSAIRLISSVNDKLTAEQLEKIFGAAGIEIDKSDTSGAASPAGNKVNDEPLATSKAAQEAGKSDGGRTTTTKGEKTMKDDDKKDGQKKADDQGKKADAAVVGKDGALDISKLDDNIRPVVQALMKQNENLSAQNDRLSKMLGDITDEIRTKQYTEKAAGEYGSIPGKSDELGGLLKSLHDKDQELAGKVEGVLKAANEAISKGGLFSEIGSTGAMHAGAGTVGGGGEAWEQVNGLATELMKADPKLTKASAIAKVAEANPQLYAQHRAEKRSH